MLRLTVLCVLLVSAWAAEECYDVGTAGTICKTRYCPAEEGACVGDTCTCVSGRGQPEILCANGDDFFASVLNDPRAWSMNNREEAEVPVPCQYLFSHVKTSVKSQSYSPNGKCDIRVNLNNQRIRGKTFVGGFAIAVKCTGLNNRIGRGGNQDIVYRADTRVNDEGKYCFNLQVSTDGGRNFNDDLQAMSARMNMAPYTFEVDPSTSRVNLIVAEAGVSAQLRPFDPQYDVFGQKWLPGFAVKYDADRDVTFHSRGAVVSLVPGEDLSQASGPDRTASEELTYRAFTGPGNKRADYPNFSDKCLAAKDALEGCPDDVSKNVALQTCSPLLAKPSFVNCHSTAGSGEVDNILEIYEQCVLLFCSGSRGACAEMSRILGAMSPSCRDQVPAMVRNFPCEE